MQTTLTNKQMVYTLKNSLRNKITKFLRNSLVAIPLDKTVLLYRQNNGETEKENKPTDSFNKRTYREYHLMPIGFRIEEKLNPAIVKNDIFDEYPYIDWHKVKVKTAIEELLERAKEIIPNMYTLLTDSEAKVKFSR